MTKLNESEARKRFSRLLGQVVDEGETVLITRRGLPVAKLVPAAADDEPEHLANVKGWLDDDDPFFATVDEIVESRSLHTPRALAPSRGAR